MLDPPQQMVRPGDSPLIICTMISGDQPAVIEWVKVCLKPTHQHNDLLYHNMTSNLIFALFNLKYHFRLMDKGCQIASEHKKDAYNSLQFLKVMQELIFVAQETMQAIQKPGQK